MKTPLLFVLFVLSTLLFAACGNSDSLQENQLENEGDIQTDIKTEEENESKTAVVVHDPLEPEADTLCEMCNMQVYTRDHEMGVFTAQGVTSEGENVFFDDVGCLLNYPRKTGNELEVKWVRDYLTKEWTEVEKVEPVKTDLTSPMNYGYVFFNAKENAETFITDHSELNPSSVEWATIDAIANERFQKKMQMQKQKGPNNSMMAPSVQEEN